jgi:hypothetical protein
MRELLDYLERAILPILESQPAPKLGEWNWPEIAEHLRNLIAVAKGELERR